MKKALTSPWLPRFLLGGFLLLMVCTVFVHVHDYGITADETVENTYGHDVLAWYTSLGGNQRFLHNPTDQHVLYHGPFFEVLVATAQYIVGHEWTTRAVITGLAGVIGVVAVMLCGYVLWGEWLALIAGLFLWGYPRYFGSILDNSKDIPFAAAMTLVLWAVLLLITQWQNRQHLMRNSLLVGLFLGMATSIRVIALLWFFILVALVACWWLTHLNYARKRELAGTALKKQALSALLIGGTCVVTVLALWPYILLNPLPHIYASTVSMSHFLWDGPVVFQGRVYTAEHLPWNYVPVWLVIGSPLYIVLFTLLGLLLGLGVAIYARRIDAPLAVVALALLTQVGLLIASHPTLYDGPRHFFFLVPLMALLAAWGCLSLCRLLWGRSHVIARLLAVLLIIATGINYGLLFKTMSDLHPYEYSYFNELVGGVAGAGSNYDNDYWHICFKPATQWIAANYRSFTKNPHPSAATVPQFQPQITLYLPPTFSQNVLHPDFYIGSTTEKEDKLFPSYTIIHTERINGQYLVCVVKMRPSADLTVPGKPISYLVADREGARNAVVDDGKTT